MITTAVILAAGLGSRLKDKTELQPKGFLELKGTSLIKRSIDNLLSSGIKQIYLGTGYLSEVYENFALNYPEIICIKSDKYRETSSMYTLYNMRNSIQEDFLLLESDLLYEKDAITHLLNDKKSDIILSSGKTNSNDEVFIETDKNSNLVGMSKNRSELKSIDGELVGISKISTSRYNSMCRVYEELHNPKIDYEYVMVETGKSSPFYIKKIEDLIWCEIDDDTHLKRALKDILPKLEEK